MPAAPSGSRITAWRHHPPKRSISRLSSTRGSYKPGEIDYLSTVGELGKEIAAEAGEHYPFGHVRSFDTKEEAAAVLAGLAEPDDLILVKGSRGMAMEHIVAALK